MNMKKLLSSQSYRWAYIKAKLSILIPSQIRALRLKSDLPTQVALAKKAKMTQSQIARVERCGENLSLKTLARVAAALEVGLIVKFVSFSEMQAWENAYSQDSFNVKRLSEKEESSSHDE